MSRASNLFRLQGIDLELDTRHARLKAIDEALADSQAVRLARQKLLETETQFSAARIAVKTLDEDLQAVSAKMAATETRTYSGMVTNPKELQDLQKEAASLKKRREALEEQQLDALIHSESVETALAQARMEVQRVEDAVSQANSALLAERTTITARVETLETEREAAWASISATDRDTYERVRRAKHGRAVVLLERGVCPCGVTVSNAQLREARQGTELVRCSNCERILYAE